jgi:hypothetical protein
MTSMLMMVSQTLKIIPLEIKRSQHHEWLIPLYYKNPDRLDDEVKVLYLEARTVTVKRTLIPNVESLEFGEIPVAFKKV